MFTSNKNNRNIFWIMLTLLSVAIQSPLLSQITITQSEFLDLFTPGSPFYFINGESSLVNIGNFNGPNIYDFTFINTSDTATGYNYSVEQIPALAVRYPSNAHTIGEGPQNIVQNPIFQENSDSSFIIGEATVETEYRFVYYEPNELFTKFPVTFNPPATNFSQWISVYDTTYDLSWQIIATDFYQTIVDVRIDGYGTLKLPGMELECLRMKRSYSWFNYKEFLYLTREGVLLVVTDVASSDPDSGFVFADYQVLFPSPSPPSVEQVPCCPNKFGLKQNYPNPFNPKTVISYQLPVSSYVTLKVYDLLGNEVATLVGEYKPAGEYEVEFSTRSHSGLSGISDISSGIYFYQLKAGSFIQTKKMILIK
ncbi:MAG: T9SS type A sorting domain-containing protein [Ignavibacteriaceae bacterium]